jgi:hypothetical protein
MGGAARFIFHAAFESLLYDGAGIEGIGGGNRHRLLSL